MDEGDVSLDMRDSEITSGRCEEPHWSRDFPVDLEVRYDFSVSSIDCNWQVVMYRTCLNTMISGY